MVYKFFLPDFFAFDHGLERRSSATHFTLMGALRVVVMEPMIQIHLQLFDAFIQVFSERDLIKLLQDGLVEPFANAVGLRMFDLGLGMIDIIDGHEELVIMFVRPAAIFGAAIRHDA